MDTPAPSTRTSLAPLADADLLDMATGLARVLTGWQGGSGSPSRSGTRIVMNESFEVWLLEWPAATSVTPHDHGPSAGAFAVVRGQLREVRWSGAGQEDRTLSAGEATTVERGLVHDVIADSAEALSVHVYSPPLSKMAFYDDRGAALLYEEAVDTTQGAFSGVAGGPPPRPGVDRLLVAARARIAPRLPPEELGQAANDGALIVDTRPAELRRRDGVIPGSVHIERNVLEWRLDPAGSHRLPEASDPDRRVILVCDEGYASSLAAASLLDLGRRNVTDLEGGFQAWRRRTARALV